MRVGLFGGTFDPPHVGHLVVAASALSFAKLEKVIWIPAAEPPHRTKPIATSLQRFDMTRLSIESNDRFEVSDIELRKDGKSYTIETLRIVHATKPRDELFLIVGADNLRAFHTWRDPDGILGLAKLIVFGRDRDEYNEVDADLLESAIIIPDTPLIGVSSSRIRKMITDGMPIRHLVPHGVADYIRTNHLYRQDG